ncbi:MAG: preprotein translocase subunit YajC [Candidatus Hydrogenedentes bacterium]|nr:preprotein translocase subunit YajC [Candidatus Hydrogenedentota bacterium]
MIERSIALLYQGMVLAQTEGGGGAAEAPRGPGSELWLFFIAFMAIMYFLMIRPNQKREKERREMLAALAKGDKVITTGGICGTIVGLNEKSVVIRVSDEPPVKIEFLRAAVTRVAKEEKEDKEK